jgi:hypothetical protein
MIGLLLGEIGGGAGTHFTAYIEPHNISPLNVTDRIGGSRSKLNNVVVGSRTHSATSHECNLSRSVNELTTDNALFHASPPIVTS